MKTSDRLPRLHAVALTHIRIVPNKYIESVNMVVPEDEALMGHLFTVAKQLPHQEDIHHKDYRLIVNTSADGGQTMFHIHLHLIRRGNGCVIRWDDRKTAESHP